MADLTYTTVPGKIQALLAKVREVGVPPKANQQWLRSIGFRSSNDASLVGVLKAVGLVDANNVPTPVWSSYRGGDHKRVLGEAIRKGYSEVFAVYPDASARSQSDLEHVFSTSSSAGKQAIAKAVSTFKNLCAVAEFKPVDQQTELKVPIGPVHGPVGATPNSIGTRVGSSTMPSVHIDVQIHISAEASAEQIDLVFKSMAKHLYGAKDRE